MTLPVNPGPDLPGPTPPVKPIDVRDVLPLDPERESQSRTRGSCPMTSRSLARTIQASVMC